MSLQEAFLHDIIEHPSDDAPRLAYADWLQEQSDPGLQARGEFIAIQCAIARNVEPGLLRERCKKRQRNLLREHRPFWLPFSSRFLYDCEFRRGFLDRVALHATDWPGNIFLAEAFELFRREPVLRHLRLRLRGYSADEVVTIGNLLNDPRLPSVSTLAIEENHLGPEAIGCLAQMAGLARFHRLLLNSNPLADEGALALANSPHVCNLVALDLTATGIEERGTMSLAQSAFLEGLLFLGLSGNDIADGIVALASSDRLRSLRTLHLAGCGIGPEPMQALLTGPLLGRLRVLDLSFNNPGEAALEQLVESSAAERLESLALWGCPISDELCQRLRARFPGVSIR